MRKLIGPDVIRTLPTKDITIVDTKLTGFAIRCRASGTHAYRLTLGRGDTRTLGRVGKMTPEAARLAAEAMLASVARDAIKHLADDPTLNLRDAKARARGALKNGTKQRIVWKRYLDEHYEPWATANRKSGADLISRLRVAFAFFDDRALREITAFDIERWRTQRMKTRVAKRSIKPSTVNRDLSALRGALSRAKEWRLIATHPMETVKAAAVDVVGRVRYLRPDEAQRLEDALTARDVRRREERERANVWRRERGYEEWPAFGEYTDHLSPIVRLALHTGCRRGELFGLKWGDVDLIRAHMNVRAEDAKSGVSRILPLNTEAVKVLRTWRPSKVSPDDHVFPGADGAPLVDIKKAWRALLDDAAITNFRFHDLRHTFASRLVMAGVDLNTVRELLGHADIKMTLRYAHLAPEHKAAAVAKLVVA
jgi:integrase